MKETGEGEGKGESGGRMGKASGAQKATNEGGCLRGNERKGEWQKKCGRGILQLEIELCVKGEAPQGKRGYSVGESEGKRGKEKEQGAAQRWGRVAREIERAKSTESRRERPKYAIG